MNKLPTFHEIAASVSAPIVFDEVDLIVARHRRYVAAKLRGLRQVPAIKVRVLLVGKCIAASPANLASTDAYSGRSS
jgi:ParB-like chromosome segregation protein Spo0J